MTHPSRLTPTANSPISTPFCKAVAVSSLVNLVMKFLALLADCVCMAAQIALATRVVEADGVADGLLIIPSRTLLLVFCWRGSVCQCCCRFYQITPSEQSQRGAIKSIIVTTIWVTFFRKKLCKLKFKGPIFSKTHFTNVFKQYVSRAC